LNVQAREIERKMEKQNKDASIKLAKVHHSETRV
jgi:hypothetical protein